MFSLPVLLHKQSIPALPLYQYPLIKELPKYNIGNYQETVQ